MDHGLGGPPCKTPPASFFAKPRMALARCVMRPSAPRLIGGWWAQSQMSTGNWKNGERKVGCIRHVLHVPGNGGQDERLQGKPSN
eukprot:7560323-Lingulodinium_polyedra.AAC.1